MKKLISNLLLLAILPVLLAGFTWAVVKAAWEMGGDLGEMLSGWLNSK